ncbi:MAG: diadenylate cyclase CdaA [Clostridiales Family XIII bacterium]|jgi:diadenylate cyclase|nr:diadenylate cyclase CdaA [Clostridiales Family XIII bacterium]
MQEFFTNLVTGISIIDAIDVAIIAFVIYKILGFLRETRAEQLVKGLFVLIIVTALSAVIHLNALNWILKGTMQFAVIALVVVFQPELRRGLEHLGRSRWIKPQLANMDKTKIKQTVSAIVDSVDYFSANHIGALIVIEREISLSDFAETGVIINSDLTPELLENVFYTGAPLHDGAVIVRGTTMYAASCILPLTKKKDLDSELGMRHRAGIGITEVSDALTIIVSEETGVISTASDGKFTRFLDVKMLEKLVLNLYLNDEPEKTPTLISLLRRKKKNVSKQ